MNETLSLTQSEEIIDLFSRIQLTETSIQNSVILERDFPVNGILKHNEMCFYKISQLSFDEDYPHREAFQNVLLSVDNQAFNFVYILTGTKSGIELCVGVVKNQNENKAVLGKKLSAVNYGDILASVFTGNFNGSRLEKMKAGELEKMIKYGVDTYKNSGVILGIPSVNESNGSNDYDFQGIDRLINSMLGLEWRLVVVCEPVSKEEILRLQKEAYNIYNQLSLYSKQTVQHSINAGDGYSYGENHSKSTGENASFTKGKNSGTSKGDGYSSSNSGSNESNTEGTSKSISNGENISISTNRGISASISIEMANKNAEELMRYIDENLLERLKIGFRKGLFNTSVYYMAKEPSHLNRLKVGIISLFQGNKSSFSPLYAQSIDLEKGGNINILKVFQNQEIESKTYSEPSMLLLGRPFHNSCISLSTYLNTEEVSLIAGLPQKEVPGISLREGVEFGLNEREIAEEESINLGFMLQKGRVLENIPFKLDRKSMAKHTFIAGVTGSGKTTTCHRLLTEADMPFLVIEPAKTEYRSLICSKHYKEKPIVVFTLGNETVAPFRINPFELIDGEVISAHVDMIKATFTSAFPMEASMPQILEEAIYKCYERKGWNIDTNTNDIYKDRAFSQEVDSFPILSELLVVMEEVVEGKKFGQELQANYIGSLVSRLSNLTVGSKGAMLNCAHSTDFEYILKNNVILEMEELKSPEDKALLMGFVLTRLSAVIKEKHKENKYFKHLTLIEEAHRLLSKIEFGDSGSKKVAVETFTDLLAEVRKYGEGLIIVDQIPNKLASEVLKNTNTKIIHKILARDDKEAVGDTMLMDDKQKEFLSALEVGQAIVFSENTDKPVHIKVTADSDTSEGQIDNIDVKAQFHLKEAEFSVCSNGEKAAMKLYPMFDKLIKQLLQGKYDKKEGEEIRKLIDTNEYGITKEAIWEELIKRQDKLSGKGMNSSISMSDRVKVLMNLFTVDFYMDDFSESNLIKKSDDDLRICSYLM